MDSFLQEHLEDYLDGRLNEQDLVEFERRLAEDAEAVAQLALLQASSLFDAFRVDRRPGACARFLLPREGTDRPSGAVVLVFLLEPVMVRRCLRRHDVDGPAGLGGFHDDTTAQALIGRQHFKQQPPQQYDVRGQPQANRIDADMLASAD
jgi:hypothetical protein